MADGSTVTITYDGADITSNVLFSSATFESQLNAQPGLCELTVKDPARSLSFVTGKRLTLSIDGHLLWAGYLTQVSRGFAFPVVDTSEIANVSQRTWQLRGVDYNILFDKRVIRNPSDYLTALPTFSSTTYDGDLIVALADDYLDVPSYITVARDIAGGKVQNVNPPFDPLKSGGHGDGIYNQQGSSWRSQLETFANLTGAIWYIDADGYLINRRLEDSEPPWGFSDVPNLHPITSTSGYEGATIGFRELEITEDGSNIVNDALVWGGSAFGSTTGGTFFAEAKNQDSIDANGLWQFGDSDHFGQLGWGSQDGVDSVAKTIVTGDPSLADPATGRGLVWPQLQFNLTWWAHQVPSYAGVPRHLHPGDLVTAVFFSLKDPAHPAALIVTLPLRMVRISFPNLDPQGRGYVEFTGYFGLQTSDPYTLWRYLLQRNSLQFQQAAFPVADNSTTSPTFGSFGQFRLQPTPDGSQTVFSIPNDIGYIPGTTTIFVDGLYQPLGDADPGKYAESDPPNGDITFNVPPHAGAEIWMVCYTTGATAGSP